MSDRGRRLRCFDETDELRKGIPPGLLSQSLKDSKDPAKNRRGGTKSCFWSLLAQMFLLFSPSLKSKHSAPLPGPVNWGPRCGFNMRCQT